MTRRPADGGASPGDGTAGQAAAVGHARSRPAQPRPGGTAVEPRPGLDDVS
ncbi:hypothetical protein M5W98_29395 [Paenibacillus apiarius]|nr:hypothetical protein [Paenibacillus apiarius]